MKSIQDAITEELVRADSLCEKEVLYWLASLYDAPSGGFYYSVSARDNEPFRPDLESTYQAVYLLEVGGMYGEGRVPEQIMPRPIADGFLRFALSLQDESDGYFYHPAIGKNISVSRKSRDLMWARGLIGKFGDRPLYPYPDERIHAHAEREENSEKQHNDPPVIEERFTSREKFGEYLESLDIDNNGWGAGNTLVSQGRQISAAGFYEMTVDFLIEHQNPDTGLWGEGLGYANTNAAMKVSGFFSPKYKSYPRLDKMVKSVIHIIKNESIPIYITDTWNPIVAINQARASYSEIPSEISDTLTESLPEVIRLSVDNARLFKKSDGAFGYNRLTGQKTSQGVTVSTGANESDINATLAACVSMRSALYTLAGRKKSPIYKPFTAEFMSLLMDKINAAKNEGLLGK